MRRTTCLTLALLGSTGAAAGAVQQPPTADSNQVRVIEIPVQDGRLAFRDLLEAVCDAVGIDPGSRLEGLDWSIDVGSTLGRVQVRLFDRIASGVFDTRVEPDRVIVEFDPVALATKEQEVRRAIGAWLGDLVPAGTPRVFGMTYVTATNPRAPIEQMPAGTTRAVVLIHGIDDPGWMWRDLIPHLLAADHTVIRFEYPNDQPIADSADLLALHLMRLRRRGIRQVDLVAHSMGGLVSRDVLTRGAYYGGDGRGGERFPAADRLIMLGTPNHGSHMAQLRGVAELREQIVRWFDGEWPWLDSLIDGAGEAGRDLLPDSDFLRRLNARPLATHTRYTIIAGRMSPVSEEALEAFRRRVQELARSETAPDWLRRRADSPATDLASSLLQEAVRGLGDGVVTIDSARLGNIADFQIVEGHHLSMIANVLDSDSTPPAIPIILDRLAADDDGTRSTTDESLRVQSPQASH